MRLSEMLTAIREYPALKIQYEAMREQQASQERTAVQLSIAYNNLQIGNRQLSQKNKALEAALAKLVPRLSSREHCRRLYKAVAPYLDPGGFVLYETAAKLTRFHISTEFATEDNMGKFEEMDGYGMLRYLTADRFGSVEYEVVAPCYEEAVTLHTDYTSPEYLTFEKKLYEKTLRELGFGKLLPEECAPQKDLNKRKEKVEER